MRGLIYTPTTQFTVQNISTSRSSPYYFYRYNFAVNPPGDNVAVLHAEVANIFLYGQVSLLLEQGTQQVRKRKNSIIYFLDPLRKCWRSWKIM